MNVLHVITGLNIGGAEIMLSRLLSRTNPARFRSSVISLTEVGAIGEEIRRHGIPVHALGMRPGSLDPRSLVRLVRAMRRGRPDVVQTWLYHADLLGGLAALAAGGAPVAWGVHNTYLEPGTVKRATVLTARACARLSPWLPTAIVCCSDATRRACLDLGYQEDKLTVIQNGTDLDRFHPDPAARLAVRRELGLPPATPLVGLLARFHPHKGHHVFVEAAGLVHARRPDVHFLLAGEGITEDNDRLTAWIEAAAIRHRCHLLDRRSDTPRLQASLDVAASSSVAESFSMVVGEAMACAVPCAVTDVGDSAALVAHTGRVVPSNQPQALADALHDLLALDAAARATLGRQARQRIADHYSLPIIVRRYEDLYERLAGGHRCAD